MKALRIILFFAFFSGALSRAHAQGVSGNTLNFSTMVTLAPGGSATLGLVVGNPPAGQTSTWYIVRVVGPSLSQFGIGNAESSPGMVVYNSQQQALTGFLEGGPTVATLVWPLMFSAVGAFPLLPGHTLDRYSLFPLPPGAYSVQVSDKSGNGGTVLVEVYVSPGPITTPI